MKWVIATNQSSIEGDQNHDWAAMTRTAVRSAIKHTTLEPFILFDGDECAFTQELRSLGVTIVYHRVSIFDFLKHYQETHYPTNPRYLQIVSGTFLRIDVPFLFGGDEFVLYTDCDIILRRDLLLQDLRPTYFACAPETKRGAIGNMNAGIMLMNIQGLKSDFAEFQQFIVQNYASIRDMSGDDYDQGAYKYFYRGRYDLLPDKYNWKPYWGRDDTAEIIHFHGPKPGVIQRLIDHPEHQVPEVIRRLYQTNPRACAYFVRQWYAYQDKPYDEDRFDEHWYRITYPDVADAIASGRLSSGLEHYQRHGRQEGRIPYAFADPNGPA